MKDTLSTQDFNVEEGPLSFLWAHLNTFLCRLNGNIDARLLRSFWALSCALFTCDQKPLLLTELSKHLYSSSVSNTAWVKRLSNLLLSKKWFATDIKSFVEARVLQFFFGLDDKDSALLIWDDSVWEKPETLHQNLCSVKSAKASLLNRIRKNYFHPPKGVVSVPGLKWSLVCLATPTKAMLLFSEFWSTRGLEKCKLRQVHQSLMSKVLALFGNRCTHVFDRGYAGWPWLEHLLQCDVNFIIRWRTGYHLCDEKGKRRLDFICGKKAFAKGQVWDAVRKCHVDCIIRVKKVHHEEAPNQVLWLVSCKRQVNGHKAWYLLTNKKIETIEQAWEIVNAYARRWEIEREIRAMKTNLRIQSIQLRNEEARAKLQAMVALILNATMELWELQGSQLIKKYNHRRGAAARQVKVAIHQLRGALATFWMVNYHLLIHSFDSMCLQINHVNTLNLIFSSQNMGHPENSG
jgi:hypothetical protein